MKTLELNLGSPSLSRYAADSSCGEAVQWDVRANRFSHDKLPSKSREFDVLHGSFIQFSKNYPVSILAAIESALPCLKESGRLVIDFIDFDAVAWYDLNFSGKLSQDSLDAIDSYEATPTIERVKEFMYSMGVSGPIFENRLEFPAVRLIGYLNPGLSWTTTSIEKFLELSPDDVLQRNILATNRPGSVLSHIVDNAVRAEEPLYETSLLMSTFIKPGNRDVLSLTMARALQQRYDQYCFLCDVTDREMLGILQGFCWDNRNLRDRTTIILSADITGIVHAWNRLFRAADGEYWFINSSDFMTHDPFKEPILSHFKQDPSLGWVMGQPAGRVGKGFAYAAGLRASAMKGVGLLSEEFSPCTCDDNDLAMKLWLQGYRVVACRHTEVSHLAKHGGGTCDYLHGISDDKLYMHWRQPRKVQQKYLGQDPKLLESCMNLWGSTPWCDE